MRPDRWYLEALKPYEATLTRKESTQRRQCELQRGVCDVELPQLLVQSSTTALSAALVMLANHAEYEFHLMDVTETRAVPVDDAVLWHMWAMSGAAVDDRTGREALIQHPAAAAIFYVRNLCFPDAVKMLLRLGDPRFFRDSKRMDWPRVHKTLQMNWGKPGNQSAAYTAWSMGEADGGGSDWVYRRELEERRRLGGAVDEAYALARLGATDKFWRFVMTWWRAVVSGGSFNAQPYLSHEEAEQFAQFSSKFRFGGQVGVG